jgi:hypothetical protein
MFPCTNFLLGTLLILYEEHMQHLKSNHLYLLHHPKNTFSAGAGRVSVTTVCATAGPTRPDGLPEGPVCFHSVHSNAFRSSVVEVSSRNSATDCFPSLRRHA